MDLKAAIASTKRFARATEAATGEYVTSEEFLSGGLSIEDYNAVDYELEPDMVLEITVAALAKAWDTAKGGKTSMAHSATSTFFKDMLTSLKRQGVNIID